MISLHVKLNLVNYILLVQTWSAMILPSVVVGSVVDDGIVVHVPADVGELA